MLNFTSTYVVSAAVLMATENTLSGRPLQDLPILAPFSEDDVINSFS